MSSSSPRREHKVPRGGRRPGAGRPRKRPWTTEFEIGQACEVLWREETQKQLEYRLNRLLTAETSIQTLWDSVNAIPVSQRRAWLASDAYEDHRGDIDAWLHKRAGTQFDERTGRYSKEADRRIRLADRPAKGTRGRIIVEIAERYGVSTDTTNRLWKAYRRFEKRSD